MPDIDKNNIRVKVKNEKSLRKDYYIEIGESIGYGLNNGKQFDSEENLCKKTHLLFCQISP